MATLQTINNAFYIRFRFGGRPYRRSLGTVGRDEAENTRMQVDVNLHRIKAQPGDTFATLAKRSPVSDYAELTLRLINDKLNGEPAPGEAIKVVE